MRKISGKICAALLAVLVISASFAASVGAYFSDYETAMGDVTLHLSGQTQIEEEAVENEKKISIKNTGDSVVVVRVAAYGPGKLDYEYDDKDWVQEESGEYFYYRKVLAPGESTSTLTASITLTQEEKDMIGDQFDVVVVQESATAAYEQNTDGKNQVIAPDGWTGFPTIVVD